MASSIIISMEQSVAWQKVFDLVGITGSKTPLGGGRQARTEVKAPPNNSRSSQEERDTTSEFFIFTGRRSGNIFPQERLSRQK